jgi:hypothetical protein
MTSIKHDSIFYPAYLAFFGWIPSYPLMMMGLGKRTTVLKPTVAGIETLLQHQLANIPKRNISPYLRLFSAGAFGLSLNMIGYTYVFGGTKFLSEYHKIFINPNGPTKLQSAAYSGLVGASTAIVAIRWEGMAIQSLLHDIKPMDAVKAMKNSSSTYRLYSGLFPMAIRNGTVGCALNLTAQMGSDYWMIPAIAAATTVITIPCDLWAIGAQGFGVSCKTTFTHILRNAGIRGLTAGAGWIFLSQTMERSTIKYLMDN